MLELFCALTVILVGIGALAAVGAVMFGVWVELQNNKEEDE